MTNEKAIFLLKLLQKKFTGEWDIKVFDMAIAALEKQEPKERIMPNSEDILDGIEYYCPNCGRAYKQNSRYDFCIKCGQALLWKDDMWNIARVTKEDTE